MFVDSDRLLAQQTPFYEYGLCLDQVCNSQINQTDEVELTDFVFDYAVLEHLITSLLASQPMVFIKMIYMIARFSQTDLSLLLKGNPFH